MTLSQIKAQVEALCRKYAKELELYLLGKVSAEFCDEVADALTNPKACTRLERGSGPVKDSFDWVSVLFKRMAKHGYGPRNLPAVQNYLTRCLQELRIVPQPREVLRALLPNAAARGLIPRTVEDPVPLCAMRRGLSGTGESNGSDSSSLGLSDLIEHWQKLDHWRQLAQGSLSASSLAEGAKA